MLGVASGRIVTRSPKLTPETLEELEAALIAADLGMPVTTQILTAVKKAYESQGAQGPDVFEIASAEVQKNLTAGTAPLAKAASGFSIEPSGKKNPALESNTPPCSC